MKRGFVYVWNDAQNWDCLDVIKLARRALGSFNLTRKSAMTLAESANIINPRNRAAILSMVENGEIEQTAFPLICIAAWSKKCDANSEAIGHILDFFEYDQQDTLQEHLQASELLTDLIREIAQGKLRSSSL